MRRSTKEDTKKRIEKREKKIRKSLQGKSRKNKGLKARMTGQKEKRGRGKKKSTENVEKIKTVEEKMKNMMKVARKRRRDGSTAVTIVTEEKPGNMKVERRRNPVPKKRGGNTDPQRKIERIVTNPCTMKKMREATRKARQSRDLGTRMTGIKERVEKMTWSETRGNHLN